MSQDDDWRDWREFVDSLTPDELLILDRVLQRRGRPRTGKGQAVHHLNGNPYDNRPENLRIVDITENRRKP